MRGHRDPSKGLKRLRTPSPYIGIDSGSEGEFNVETGAPHLARARRHAHICPVVRGLVGRPKVGSPFPHSCQGERRFDGATHAAGGSLGHGTKHCASGQHHLDRHRPAKTSRYSMCRLPGDTRSQTNTVAEDSSVPFRSLQPRLRSRKSNSRSGFEATRCQSDAQDPENLPLSTGVGNLFRPRSRDMRV